MRALNRKHAHEIVEDVDDKIFMLQGHAMHAVLERAGGSTIVEKRLFGEVNGVRISAQVDSLCLQNETLIDWKNTSVFAFKKAPKWEWTAQMNIQLELLRQNGMDAKKLQIWGICRDWRPREAKKDKNYPNKIACHDIEMKSREHIRAFIAKRIELHRAAEKELPLCSEHDHWMKKRCGDYCSVSRFCTQYRPIKPKEDQRV